MTYVLLCIPSRFVIDLASQLSLWVDTDLGTLFGIASEREQTEREGPYTHNLRWVSAIVLHLNLPGRR